MTSGSYRHGRGLDFLNGRIDMSHGAGGKATAQLIDELFIPAFNNPELALREDQAVFDLVHDSSRIAVTTDCHVVSPLFFAGGDIGSLSVYGTVNDLAVGGAEPVCITAGFIIEEGFPLSQLRRIIESMQSAQHEAGVKIVAGDTKVVERGKGDGVFITTTGVGVINHPSLLRRRLGMHHIQPGDAVVLSGRIAEHGVAVMSQREHFSFGTSIVSDSAPLTQLTRLMLDLAPHLRCMRDPTRGGVAAVLNEFAQGSSYAIEIDEQHIPVSGEVQSACEILGIDPLYVANEGKIVAICPQDEVEALLKGMRSHPLGREASVIGHVLTERDSLVQAKSIYGGKRLIQWLAGDPLPRIC